ncbi:hypothetical protein PG988_012558 [Apiospora saccharicola]
MSTISPIHPFKFPRLGILELLHSRRGGPFERLPTEIIVDILLWLDELVSLDCLLHASPVVYRIFDEFAVRVTEAILYNGYGPIRKGLHTVEPDKPSRVCSFVPVQMYMVAMIRSGTLPLPDLAEFVARVIMPYHLDDAGPPYTGPLPFSPRVLPADTPPAVVRSLVATSRHLTALSVECLKFYLDRFRSIRPSHPIVSERDFDKLHPKVRHNLDLEPWKNEPEGHQVPVQDHGPPTWLEEQRVLRAFWCLQMIVDLRKAAASSSSRLLGRRWPPGDVKYLRECDATNVWSLEKLLRPHVERHRITSLLAESVQYRETMAVTWYLETVHKRRWPAPEDLPQQQQQPRLEVRREGPAPPRRRQHDVARLSGGQLAGFVYFLVQHTSYTSLGRYAPYNALGFSLWSDERMEAAQLAWRTIDDVVGRSAFWRRRVAYAWLSVLGAEDRRRLVEFRRAQRELAERLPTRSRISTRRLRAGLGDTPGAARLFMQQNWVAYLAIDFN